MQLDQKDLNKKIYDIFEDKRAIKFLDKHINHIELIDRIYEKYSLLSVNPYKEAEKSFKSKKMSYVKKLELEIIE